MPMAFEPPPTQRSRRGQLSFEWRIARRFLADHALELAHISVKGCGQRRCQAELGAANLGPVAQRLVDRTLSVRILLSRGRFAPSLHPEDFRRLPLTSARPLIWFRARTTPRPGRLADAMLPPPVSAIRLVLPMPWRAGPWPATGGFCRPAVKKILALRYVCAAAAKLRPGQRRDGAGVGDSRPSISAVNAGSAAHRERRSICSARDEISGLGAAIPP